ncbi:MAG: hypothetical protein PHS96_04220 [Anaerolineales bacterium]|nr:hypothetical protein [Anaerolineales bacterium]
MSTPTNAALVASPLRMGKFYLDKQPALLPDAPILNEKALVSAFSLCHTLADCRTAHEAALGGPLKEGVAAFRAEGLINLEEMAQHGIRIRGRAGINSFHWRHTLEKHLKKLKNGENS